MSSASIPYPQPRLLTRNTVHGVTVDDALEKVPDFEADWSLAYYKTVKRYWDLFLKTDHHPIQGLFNGLIEIFCNSYNNLGIHEVMFDSAVLEITSFIERTYDVIGYLFPSLPSKDDMYHAIPEAAEEGESPVTQEQENFNVPTPACEFVLESLFSKCYADLFTMYTIKSQELDQRYWYCVSALNSVTDVRLLKHFGVDQSLWPMFTSSGSDELQFAISSRRKFYESAVVTLQSIGCKFTPSDKLRILTKTFSDINEALCERGRPRLIPVDVLVSCVVSMRLDKLNFDICSNAKNS
uniref:Cullin domain-containing protein n=1 Tax=Panagrellus redivivus TaxID=6233 RepID=A0A7E4ZVT4_PANRE